MKYSWENVVTSHQSNFVTFGLNMGIGAVDGMTSRRRGHLNFWRFAGIDEWHSIYPVRLTVYHI